MNKFCMKTGCKDKPGTNAVRITIRTEDHEGFGYLNIVVCDEHKIDADVNAVLDQNWSKLCYGFSKVNLEMPDRNLATWEWVPVQEAEEFFSGNEGRGIKIDDFKPN